MTFNRVGMNIALCWHSVYPQAMQCEISTYELKYSCICVVQGLIYTFFLFSF